MEGLRRAEAWLFWALLLAAAAFRHPVEYDNERSRYLATSAIVDRGRLDIDGWETLTGDRSSFGGHSYSNKPFGAPLLAAPVLWALRRTVLPLGDKNILFEPAALYLIRLITTTFAFAWLGVLLLRVAGALGPPRRALASVVAWGFGTIALQHAALFSGHGLAAAFGFGAFYILFFYWRDQEGKSLLWGLAAGFCAGMAGLCDYPGMIVTAALLVYGLSMRPRAAAAATLLTGAGVCAAALALYDRCCFGGFLTLSMARTSGALSVPMGKGLLGFSFPSPRRAAYILLSPSRGFFMTMPVLAAVIPGAVSWKRIGRFRRERLLAFALGAAFLLLLSTYNGSGGGWTYGPRYATDALPFLILPMAFAAGGWGFWGLFALSAVGMAGVQAGVAHVPPDIRNPLVEVVWPLLRTGFSSTLFVTQNPKAALLYIAAVGAVCAAFIGLAFRGLARGPRPSARVEAGYAAWALIALLTVGLSRTPDFRAVLERRATLLEDGAGALGSFKLSYKAAQWRTELQNSDR